MAEYTSAYTGAQIDAAIADAQTALQAADMATTVSLAASAVQPAYTGNLAITGNESISGNLTFTGTGNRITGDLSSSAPRSNKIHFQTSVAASASQLGILPASGATLGSTFVAFSRDTPDNSSNLALTAGSDASGFSSIASGANGTGTFKPLRLNADGGTAITLTASGTSTSASNPLVLIRATSTSDTVTPLQVTGAIKSSVYTVATLPTGTAGCRSFVSDSNATLAAGHGNVVAAGGANFCPVYHDGTNWRIG